MSIVNLLVGILAGAGAGIGTGLVGLSASAVISPMLITFLDMPAYEAIGISLASDVLASAACAVTYARNKNINLKNGLIMLVSVLMFTMIGSYAASFLPNRTMGGFSVFMTLFLGLRFIFFPVMTSKEENAKKSNRRKIVESLLCGILVGFICGFIGAGGGMMLLLVLSSVLGYDLKTAVGTSVLIMAFTAFTGAVSHFAIGGIPDMFMLTVCIISTLVFAQLSAKYANNVSTLKLNRISGTVLSLMSVGMILVKYL